MQDKHLHYISSFYKPDVHKAFITVFKFNKFLNPDYYLKKKATRKKEKSEIF